MTVLFRGNCAGVRDDNAFLEGVDLSREGGIDTRDEKLEAGEDFGGAEAAFYVALQGLEGESS